MTLFDEFVGRAGLPAEAELPAVVEAVRRMPYARPTPRTAQGALTQWRGTCSTKHALLAAVLADRWPLTRPELVHRVYQCTPEVAGALFGPTVARTVPAPGLWDVHCYLTIAAAGRRVVIDVTFPGGAPWDGRSDLPLACGPGSDYPAGADPGADKRALEQRFCDPATREPFIAALAAQHVHRPNAEPVPER